jgi:hypothetical protein
MGEEVSTFVRRGKKGCKPDSHSASGSKAGIAHPEPCPRSLNSRKIAQERKIKGFAEVTA